MSRSSRFPVRMGVVRMLCIPIAYLLLECLPAGTALAQDAAPGVPVGSSTGGDQRLIDRLKRFRQVQRQRGAVRPSADQSPGQSRFGPDHSPATAGTDSPTGDWRNTQHYGAYRSTGTGVRRNDQPYRSYRSHGDPGGFQPTDNRIRTGIERTTYSDRESAIGYSAASNSDGLPSPVTRAAASALQPQTPGEIPELVPEDRSSEQYYLPETQQPRDAESGAWQRFRQRLSKDSAAGLLKTYGAATWVFAGDNDVGMFDIFLQGTFVVPWIKGFTVTPVFQVYFVDHPDRVDIPAQLYSSRMEFCVRRQIAQQFRIDISLAPGVYSDFEQGDSESFRLQARVLGIYYLAANSEVVFGIVYLDREDVKLLPALGWIWVPREDWRFEFLFPRPKIAKRFSQHPLYSRWGYLMGEFGGGSWSVERSTGQHDVLSYRDLRLIFGFEQRYTNGRSLFLEVGVVFNREIEFRSDRGDFDPSTAGMLRAGLNY